MLRWLEQTFDELLAERRASRTPTCAGSASASPVPVEFATGTPVAPPIMPGWDGYRVSDRLADYFGAPTLVDNDVNIMALGEHWKAWRAYDHLLFVKVGDRHRLRDHHRRPDPPRRPGRGGRHRPHPRARATRRSAAAATAAASRRWPAAARWPRGCAREGIDAENSRDVVRHVRDGRPEAMQLVRQAGRELGEVLAASVNFFNPGVIVIGGDIAHADEHLLAGVREVVYQRAVPLGTRSLRIVRSALDDRAGVIGAAVMVIEHVLAPDVVDRMLARRATAARS